MTASTQTAEQVGEKRQERQARFKRLAEARTNKALKSIGLIGNLTGANYESTGVQRDTITNALENAVIEMAKKLDRTVEKETSSFSL